MSTLQAFSEKERAYHQYQARQNYLRQQQSIQQHIAIGARKKPPAPSLNANALRKKPPAPSRNANALRKKPPAPTRTMSYERFPRKNAHQYQARQNYRA